MRDDKAKREAEDRAAELDIARREWMRDHGDDDYDPAGFDVEPGRDVGPWDVGP